MREEILDNFMRGSVRRDEGHSEREIGKNDENEFDILHIV